MKKLIYLSLILFITGSAYAQEVKIGTVFTIEFSDLDKRMDFKVVPTGSYQGEINISNIDSAVFKGKPKSNQIFGAFAKDRSGDMTVSTLVLLSGLDSNLDYHLKIKLPGMRKFENTSTSVLRKNVKSVEYWPYYIEKINFKNFKVLPIDTEDFQLSILNEIDSACIKNADKTIKHGEQEFVSNFKSIVQSFEHDNTIKIDKQLKYEHSINSANISLGYFWSLDESMYPDINKFKFADPLTYQRLECPFFSGSVNYFYTKRDSTVKVVYFEWEEFKKSLFEDSTSEKDITPKFIEKYTFIVSAVTQLMGKPISIEQEKNSGRIDTRWSGANGIDVYLYRFTEYNQIRLCVYKR